MKKPAKKLCVIIKKYRGDFPANKSREDLRVTEQPKTAQSQTAVRNWLAINREYMNSWKVAV